MDMHLSSCCDDKFRGLGARSGRVHRSYSNSKPQRLRKDLHRSQSMEVTRDTRAWHTWSDQESSVDFKSSRLPCWGGGFFEVCAMPCEGLVVM